MQYKQAPPARDLLATLVIGMAGTKDSFELDKVA